MRSSNLFAKFHVAKALLTGGTSRMQDSKRNGVGEPGEPGELPPLIPSRKSGMVSLSCESNEEAPTDLIDRKALMWLWFKKRE